MAVAEVLYCRWLVSREAEYLAVDGFHLLPSLVSSILHVVPQSSSFGRIIDLMYDLVDT